MLWFDCYISAESLSALSHTHTRLMALCLRLPVLAGTRKVKPIWILLQPETVSGSGSSWAICKSAPRCRQITTPAPHHSVFTGRVPFLPLNQQHQSSEGRNGIVTCQQIDWLIGVVVVAQAASARGEGFMFSISDSDQTDDSPAGSNADDDDDEGGRSADRSRCTTSWSYTVVVTGYLMDKPTHR